jgi:23S rRNA pseudouridine1911/1915/1917 synthase
MSKQFQFCITQEDARQRLDVFLAARFGGLSRIRINNLLNAGACSVNQQTQSAGYHLKVGDWVEMTLDEGAPTAMSPENIALEILYEDQQFLVVVKPTGMLVHPTRNVKSGTLLNALAYHLNHTCGLLNEQSAVESEPGKSPYPQFANADLQQQDSGDLQTVGDDKRQAAIANPLRVVRPGLVHRLDRATSGVMVIATTQRALSLLTKHFHNRLVKKLYLAVVEGEVAEASGSIIAPLGLDEKRRPQRWVMEDGKSAETLYRVLERRSGATLLELEPITGRTNQLRIHCAYIGHPIIGDDLYRSVVDGLWPVACEEMIETGNTEKPLTNPAIPAESTGYRLQTNGCRLCLHAAKLAFHHPDDGRWVEFHSPMPDDMAGVWQAFG